MPGYRCIGEVDKFILCSLVTLNYKHYVVDMNQGDENAYQ